MWAPFQAFSDGLLTRKRWPFLYSKDLSMWKPYLGRFTIAVKHAALCRRTVVSLKNLPPSCCGPKFFIVSLGN